MLLTNQLAGFSIVNMFTVNIVIRTYVYNVDLMSLVKGYYPSYDMKSPVHGTIVNDTNNIIGGKVQGAYSLICNLPEGSTVTFTNLGGYIVGKGGDGAPDNGYPTAGSPAIQVLTPITINNQGIVGGGGGGGGQAYWSSGGGGAGWVVGTGGQRNAVGQPGTLLTGGAGGHGSGKNGSAWGGTGGNLGAAGGAGTWDNSGGDRSGAAAGIAIQGESLISWVTRGDIRGTVNS